MDRKKILYVGIILIVTVMVSVTYFSYAFFTSKEEYHGKINVVAGTLDYEMTSNDLDSNNSITVPANSVNQIEISVKSLNNIRSKYGLFYNANQGVVAYYRIASNSSLDSIDANATIPIQIIIVNDTAVAQTVTFTVDGGFENNGLAPVSPYSTITGTVVADEVEYTDTNTLGCTDAQCALDKIAEILDDSE